MRKPPPKPARWLPLFGLLFLLLLYLKNGEIAANGIEKGLYLSTRVLIPSLFPFLVLSELFLRLDAGEALGKLVERPFRALFGVSGKGASALFSTLFCGLPVGAAATARLLEKGEITGAEARRLLLFCNMPGLGFVVGTVGVSLLGSRALGALLFASLALSCLFSGLFLRLLFGKLPVSQKTGGNGVEKAPTFTEMTACVKRALNTLLQVVAFVLFFSSLSECFTAFLGERGTGTWGALLCGLLEMTRGVGAAAALPNLKTALTTTAFLLGFSGISVAAQVLSVAENAGLRFFPYLLFKFFQGGLTLLIATGLFRLFYPTGKDTETLLQTGSVPTFDFRIHAVCLAGALAFLLLLSLFAAMQKGRKNKTGDS